VFRRGKSKTEATKEEKEREAGCVVNKKGSQSWGRLLGIEEGNINLQAWNANVAMKIPAVWVSIDQVNASRGKESTHPVETKKRSNLIAVECDK